MPILAPGAVTPPPVIGPETLPSDRTVITWISANGEEIPLTGDISGDTTGVIVQPGLRGFDSPAISLVMDEMPAQDGSVFRSKRSPTRELMIPLFLWAPTRADYLSLRRQLINQMSPDDGIGTLRVYEPSLESTRYIRCYLSSGMEGDDTASLTNGYTYGSYGVILHAPDPYFYGPTINERIELSTVTPINFYTGKNRGDPTESTGPFMVPGLHLSSSYIPAGNRTINIDGAVEAWPIWTVTTASANSFTLWNKTTDKLLTLNHVFPAGGDTVTIDSRPGFKTVTSALNGNVYSELAANPSFWSLKAGDNEVEVDLASSGTGVSGVVTLQYDPRYRGT